jgi:hypothetical protein
MAHGEVKDPLRIMFDLIENSTYIQNINRGVAYTGPDPSDIGVQRPASFFGATTGEGMAHTKGSLYNSTQSRPVQDTRTGAPSNPTPIQSNYMSLNGIARGSKA